MAATANERFIRAAKDAGCPRDQVLNFLRMGCIMQPKQLEASAWARRCDDPDGPDELGYGGARGGGKSHWGVGQLADDCQRYPGLKCLLLRKVGKSGKENFSDLLPKVLGGVKYEWKSSLSLLLFPNGSRILAGHYQKESDIEAYLGIEYDVILIEEATTLSWSKYYNIKTCCRTSKPGWRPRMYSTTNPGGIGHAWYKKRFITNPDPSRVFIHATIDDNAFVNPEYRRTLDGLSGWQLRAWRHGDWDIAAGQYFTTFRRDVHVVPPFAIPSDWRLWGAMDYGFVHPQAMYLLGQDPDGNIYHIGEHVDRQMLPQQHADAYKAMLARHGVTMDRLWTFVAGTDVFSKRGDDGITTASKYGALGFDLKPANTDRINGASEYLQRLGDVDRGIPARMFYFDSCPRLIDCVPMLQHDPNRGEDVLKVDADDDGEGGDDAYDASRYGVMALWNPAQSILDHYKSRFEAQQ